MEIKKSTYVPEALKASKHVAEVFRKHDLKCLKCKGWLKILLKKLLLIMGLNCSLFLMSLIKQQQKNKRI